MKRVARAWCWTLYPEDGDVTKPPPFKLDPFSYIVWQGEMCPKTLRPHYQGYLELPTKKLGSALKSLMCPTIHLETRTRTQKAAIAYCKKEETQIVPPTEHGAPMSQGSRSDLHCVISHLLQGKKLDPWDPEHARAIVLRGPGLKTLEQRLLAARGAIPREDLRVTVMLGPPRVGKSTLVRTEADAKGWSIYTAALPCPSGGRWFDGYTDQDIFLIEDYEGDIKFRPFLQMLDKWPCELPGRGGDRQALYTQVYITTNVKPEMWYPTLTAEQRLPLIERIHRICTFTAPGKFTEWVKP